MHPAHEAGMHIAGRIGHDEIGEFAIDIGEIGRRCAEALAKLRAHRIRDRLPDRALADGRDVVDHVVEHAMTLRAEFVPVLRIERLARSPTGGAAWRGSVMPPAPAALAARRSSIAANASKILRICGGL